MRELDKLVVWQIVLHQSLYAKSKNFIKNFIKKA